MYSFIKKSSFILFIAVIIGFPMLLHSQESLIQDIKDSIPAIVTIRAKVILKKGKTAGKRFIDPKTGRTINRAKIQAYVKEQIGAGVIIDTRGIIVTNTHNIANAKSVTVVFHNKKRVPVKKVKVVPGSDISFLKVTSKEPLQRIEIANSDLVQLRDDVINVGNSKFIKDTLSGGNVIGLGRAREGDNKSNQVIHTNINLYKGDSGGPLLNNKGELIGLIAAKQSKKNYSTFAIPSNRIVEHLLKYHDELIEE